MLSLRSHSKGSLARFKSKIEHKRILKNDEGRRVLDALVRDNILYLNENFYHWNPDTASKCVGVTWEALRKGEMNDMLYNYLEKI